MPCGEALRLFADGIAGGDLVFDRLSYVYVIGACARSRTALWEGKEVHCRVLKIGLGYDVVVGTTCIHFYGSHGDCGSARKMFDEMGDRRTSATWNAMISGYCSQKKGSEYFAHAALKLFCGMLRCGNNGVNPNDTTMVSVLSACARIGDLVTGSCVHGRIEKIVYVPHDVYIGTCLVDMYSKCGCLKSALVVFNRMKMKNILTWTSMISGLALHGQGKSVLNILEAMQVTNIRPNAVTFTSLLFACGHAGLVNEGLVLFYSMGSRFGVTPNIQHYGCIVDLLGRAGRLQEAYNFVIEMPLQPDKILWRSLLAACKIHGNSTMGEKVGKHLLQLQEESGTVDTVSRCEDFIALSNVYASTGRWKDLEMVREKMKDKCIQAEPGYSSVQLV
ncbi:hypothetical protein IFM89_008881 [Coptis chinensis]|uniref:Pentatricopeptide repeat-containing protein n=1 Tax=Coptis chinensis TaxID=261450 RepID=A0A835LRB1_9MAGN|nr:hypothetical protein IFM89_008881 [Coptis chinensis]